MFGRKFVRKSKLATLERQSKGYFDLEFIRSLPENKQARCLSLLDQSQSQLRQDLFALSVLDFKRDGFFVEFGATDGVELSNTVLMERGFGWRGVLAEPAIQWHAKLQKNRTGTIDTRCVWKTSGENLDFTQTPRGENSGLTQFVKRRRQVRGTTFSVETVSLLDLLNQHNAPKVIDFASIDTEGSEFDILNAFDFSKYRFKVMVIEHNFAPQRSEIQALLTKHGYKRVLESVSRFDDWYLLQD
jgi:FkbM family methyltransferase